MVQNLQVRKNLFLNLISLLTNICIGILYTPFLVKTLGVIAYGVIPLALLINQYISILTGSLTSALTRFYSISLQKNKLDEASAYLSTSFFVIIGIIFIFSIPTYFFIKSIDSIFNIPLSLIKDAKLLFSFTILSFFLSLVSSVLNITLYANNRLDNLNVLKITRITGRFIFVFLLFTFLDSKIGYVGIANLISEMIVLVISCYMFFGATQDKIKIRPANFKLPVLKAVGGMALWVIIQQIGDTGIYKIDVLFLNLFWSSKESGVLGALGEIGSYILTISAVVGSLFGPLILIAYSKGDHTSVKEMTLSRSLTIGIMVAVLAGIICGFSPFILRIWLGSEFLPFQDWLILKLFLVPFYASAGVFAFAARAWNRIRFIAICTIFIGLLNLLCTYIIGTWFKHFNYSIEGILVITIIFGLIQSYILNGLVFSRLYKNTRRLVILNFFKILSVFAIITSLARLISNRIIGLNNLTVLTIIGLTSLVLFGLSFKIALSKQQIRGLISIVYK